MAEAENLFENAFYGDEIKLKVAYRILLEKERVAKCKTDSQPLFIVLAPVLPPYLLVVD